MFVFLFWPCWSSAFLVKNDKKNPMPHPQLRVAPRKNFVSSLHVVNNKDNENDEQQQQQQVKVGSKEYLEGFIRSPIQDSTVQETRGSGLEQGLKLAGSVTAALVVLFLGFMVSNGLI
jgi:hypothetical protein